MCKALQPTPTCSPGGFRIRGRARAEFAGVALGRNPETGGSEEPVPTFTAKGGSTLEVDKQSLQRLGRAGEAEGSQRRDVVSHEGASTRLNPTAFKRCGGAAKRLDSTAEKRQAALSPSHKPKQSKVPRWPSSYPVSSQRRQGQKARAPS